MFLGNLIFDQKWGFCMGYSFCMMADFHNGLIFRIFGVFSISFFAKKKSTWFVEWILTCFLKLQFFTQSEDFAWAIYCVYMMSDFQNKLISRIFGVFGGGFFNRSFLMICRLDFDMFFRILISDPKWGFCICYSLCLVAGLQNCLISRIFGVFSSCFFAH